MYYCKNCGEPYMTDEAVMCIKCGVAKGQGNNYCHNCGKPLAPDAAVCLNRLLHRMQNPNWLPVSWVFFWVHSVFIIFILATPEKQSHSLCLPLLDIFFAVL